MAEPKIFILWNRQAGPSAVPATTLGQAIEYWLASHGLFGYDELWYIEADRFDTLEEVEQLVQPDDRLDKHTAAQVACDKFIDAFSATGRSSAESSSS